MDHPFINASDLSDDELYEKIKKCTEILYSETHWGHNNVVNSVRSALTVYEQELQERMFIRQHNEITAKDPDGIIEIGTIDKSVDEYDENDNSTVEVKRHKDL